MADAMGDMLARAREIRQGFREAGEFSQREYQDRLPAALARYVGQLLREYADLAAEGADGAELRDYYAVVVEDLASRGDEGLAHLAGGLAELIDEESVSPRDFAAPAEYALDPDRRVARSLATPRQAEEARRFSKALRWRRAPEN